MTCKTSLMQRIFIIILLLTPLRCLYAQDRQVIDSVVPLIRNDGSRNDMEIFYELAFQYSSTDYSRSLEYLGKGLDIALKLGDSLKIVKINRMTAQLMRRQGRQTEAIAVLEKTLPIASRRSYQTELADIYTALAITHTFLAHFDLALQYNFRALEAWREQMNQEEIANVLNNIGLVHFNVGNYDKAIDYYSQALVIAERQKAAGKMELYYSNLGLANISKKDTSEARRWFDRLSSSCAPACIPERAQDLEFGMGYLAYSVGKFRYAKERLLKAHELAIEIKNPLNEAECLLALGEVNQKEKNYLIAESLIKESLKISGSNNYRSLAASAYIQLYELYKATQRSTQASLSLERYVQLRDSIYSVEVRNKIMVAQTEFEEKENILIIQHNNELLGKQKTQTRLVIAIGALILAIAIGLYVILRNKLRANKMLDHRVKERTRELESHKASLQRAYDEQKELLLKTSKSLRSAVATQKGLRVSMSEAENLSQDDVLMAQGIEMELDRVNSELLKANQINNSIDPNKTTRL